MLLNQFKVGTISGSSLRNAISRNGVVTKKSELLQVRTSNSQSSTVGKLVSGRSKKDHGNHDTVVYKGTIVVVKKLVALDQIDRGAAIQDDISELRGKHVSVQLVVDSKTEKTSMSSPVRVKGWASKLATQLHFTFTMDFEVPRGMGVPGAILVRNDHPNEFLLVAFSLTLDDSKTETVHYLTNSWVYNTSRSGARIFLRE